VKVDKRHWKGNMRTAYSKHQYVYEKVHIRSLSIGSEFRGNGQEKMMQAAELLDDERGTMTMAQFLTHLKQQDPQVRRRTRTEREGDYEQC
jgi:hypothetical protein